VEFQILLGGKAIQNSFTNSEAAESHSALFTFRGWLDFSFRFSFQYNLDPVRLKH